MKIPGFKLEEYFTQHEFSVPYMLGSSDPETSTLAELLQMADNDSLALWNNLRLSYTEYYGLPALRDEISKLYTKQTQKNVLVFAGAQEAIYITMNILLKPQDEVVVITPCYQSLKEIAKTLGAKVIEVGLQWQNSHWDLDFEQFKAAVNSKTKMIIVNFPHNPTGYMPDHKTFQAIIDLARQYNAYLFSDEVYRLSEYNVNDRLPNAADCYEKALSLGVMSKSFGLAGLRIGWLVTQDTALLGEYASYKNYTSMCNSAPSEVLAVIALKNKAHILKRNLAITQHNLQRLEQFFSHYRSLFESYSPKAGFVLFPRLKIDIAIDTFAEQLTAQEGVLIIPGTLFDTTTNHFRMGLGRRNFPEALERFERFIQQYA